MDDGCYMQSFSELSNALCCLEAEVRMDDHQLEPPGPPRLEDYVPPGVEVRVTST
jgi:hypothetical protein